MATKTSKSNSKPSKSTSKTAAPTKVSGKTASERAQSLADIWDNTDASEASNNLPPGEHEVRLNEITLSKDPKKGDAAIVKYEAIDGDHEGKTLRQLYKLRDADGGKGPGVAYLMRDLELLGYKDIDGKKLPKVLKEISEEQPMVIINAKQNGQYINAYLQGTPEDVKGGKGGDDEDEEDEAEIEVGSKVKGTNDDGDEVEGEVKKINKKKETATVEDEDGEEHTCDLSDLELVDEDADEEEEEEEEEAEEIEVGDTVTGENEDGDEVTGEVLSIKKGVATVKDEDGDKHKCAVEDLKKDGGEEEEEEEEAEATAPEVGDEVKFTDPDDEDETLEGEVVKVNEKKETFDAKVGKKTIKGIAFDAIQKDEEEEEEEEEEENDEIAKGDEVKWEDEDGDDMTGTVIKIVGKKATVKDEDGDKHEVKLSDLTKE